MLRKHLNSLSLSEVRVDVAVKSSHQDVESLSVLATLCNEVFDALDMFVSNFSNILCPKFPISLGAHLGYHLGIEYILQVFKLQWQFFCHIHGGTILVLMFLAVSSMPISMVNAVIVVWSYTAKENMLWLLLWQFYGIDFCIETVIMGTKSIEYRPNHLEVRMLLQYFVALHILRHYHWNDNVTIFLPFAAAHDTTDRLHNIYLWVFRWDENDSIEWRYIHTLAQTTGIG